MLLLHKLFRICFSYYLNIWCYHLLKLTFLEIFFFLLSLSQLLLWKSKILSYMILHSTIQSFCKFLSGWYSFNVCLRTLFMCTLVEYVILRQPIFFLLLLFHIIKSHCHNAHLKISKFVLKILLFATLGHELISLSINKWTLKPNFICILCIFGTYRVLSY